MSEEIELSVVVPCFEEASHLAGTLAAIRAQVEPVVASCELIVVDDGSDDGTWDVVTAAARAGDPVRGVRLSRRFGKELALCAGLERARGRAVIVMDGDLQHPPELIPDMVRAWRDEGYEVVEAVKDSGGEPAHVRLRARLFYAILNRLSGIRLARASDFKLLDRKVLEAWAGMPERHVFFRGMSAWLGFRRKELSFRVAPRAGGRTSWSTRELFRLAVDGLTSFSTLPLHLITTVGLLFLVFALVLGTNALVQKFTGVALTGFTTVIVLQLMIGSMLMMGLGILGQYVSKIYDEVKGRPRYVVTEETVGDGGGEAGR